MVHLWSYETGSFGTDLLLLLHTGKIYKDRLNMGVYTHIS